MSRKLLSLALALCLTLSLAVIPAAANGTEEPLESTSLAFYSSADCGAGSYIERDSTVSYYTLPTMGTLWLRSDEEIAAESLSIDGPVETYSLSEDRKTVEIELDEDEFAPTGNNIYTRSLSASVGGESVIININNRTSTSSMSIEVNGEEYVVGFAELSGDPQTIIQGPWVYRGVTGEPNEENAREFFYSPVVSVAKLVKDKDGTQRYEFGGNMPVSVKVTGMEIRPAYSEDGNTDFGETFSFEEEPTAVLQTSSVSGNRVNLYRKLGYTTTAVLLASVEITAGDETLTGAVALQLMAYRIAEETVVCEANDSVDTINSKIEAAVKELPGELGNPYQGTVHVELHGERYEGYIELPENIRTNKGDYEIRFESKSTSGRTTIVGGADMNNSTASFYDIDFVAPSSPLAGETETRALYGGQAWTVRCTLSGYDVAMDDGGHEFCGMSMSDTVFADNGIALRVSLPDQGAMGGIDRSGNAFINNGTAVQILSLGESVMPYYYRISDCSFVNNGVTFDVRHPGTFYFYRNYYGRVKQNAGDMSSAEILAALESDNKDIQSQPPTVKIAEHSQTKVVTNPRWKDPLDIESLPALSGGGSGSSGNSGLMRLAASSSEGNYLTADWELPTEIVIGDEDDLEISAAAFAEATSADRVISVVRVDEGEPVLLGEWNFGTAAHPNLSGSFDASLEVTENEDGEKTVKVSANSGLLAALQPTLTIPGAAGGVEHGDEGVPSDAGAGSVSFKVSGAGDYVISEENPEIPMTPDVPGVPVTPGEPDEPELSFNDLAAGAWYTDAVNYVVAHGLMEGTSAATFEPETALTRAMLVTILWRAEGEPVVNYLLPFTDVPGETWYTEAVRWAASEGIVTGVSAAEFAPNAAITREQLVTMLWRYAGEPAAEGGLSGFADAGDVSGWAGEAFAWAVGNGVITGVTQTRLDPRGGATRAQAAAMLSRFDLL